MQISAHRDFLLWQGGRARGDMTQQAIDPKTEDPKLNEDPAGPDPGTQDPEVVPDADPVAELATELGWNPDYTGANAKSAREYILESRRIQDDLSERLRGLKRSTSRELAAMRDGIDTIKWSMEQENKRNVDRLQAEIADLKAKRRTAVQDGEVDTVEAFDQQIESRQNAVRAAEAKPPTPRQPAADPAWDEWVPQNQWYNTDADLKQYADNLSQMPAYLALPFDKRLDRIAAAVRQMFPDKFTKTPKPGANANPTSDPPPPASPHSAAAVAPVSPSHHRARPKGKTSATAADLSYEERQAGEAFVGQGLFKSLDEYAQKLAEHEAAKAARR